MYNHSIYMQQNTVNEKIKLKQVLLKFNFKIANIYKFIFFYK